MATCQVTYFFIDKKSLPCHYSRMIVHACNIIWERKVERYFLGRRVPATLQKVQYDDGRYGLVEIYDQEVGSCPTMDDPGPWDRYPHIFER